MYGSVKCLPNLHKKMQSYCDVVVVLRSMEAHTGTGTDTVRIFEYNYMHVLLGERGVCTINAYICIQFKNVIAVIYILIIN